MSERDPHKAIDFIYKQAPLYAKAKAERVRLEEFRKSKKALLMAECEAPAYTGNGPSPVNASPKGQTL